MKRLGFIGAGNMGGAILSGLLRKGCLTADQVMVSDKAEGQLSRYAQLWMSNEFSTFVRLRRSFRLPAQTLCVALP